MSNLSSPMTKEEFVAIGVENGFTIIPPKNDIMKEGVRMQRDSNGNPEIITYWETTGKISTVIKNHPKYGNSQQFSSPNRDQLVLMLTNSTGPGRGLRTHTGTGYRERKNSQDVKGM